MDIDKIMKIETELEIVEVLDREIPCASKTFTLILEVTLKIVNLGERDINIKKKSLRRSRFADSIVVFGQNKNVLVNLLRDIEEAWKKIGLEINFQNLFDKPGWKGDEEEQLIIGDKKGESLNRYKLKQRKRKPWIGNKG